jgi:excisionase family DNA binding protein
MSLLAQLDLRYTGIKVLFFTKGVGAMTEMLDAKEMQVLLEVDRSTIYRMAEAGRLPAIKVGRQWRFPRDRVDQWLGNQTTRPGSELPVESSRSFDHLAVTLPFDCVQLIQDAFAELLTVMLVITDLAGHPITQVSNPSLVYKLLAESENGHELCQEEWRDLGQIPALEPRFVSGWGGILCARALIRLGNELKGMVIVSGVAPPNWPPPDEITTKLAQSLQISPDELQSAFASVVSLTPAQQKQVLLTTQRIADILTHVVGERCSLMDRLDTIAKLSNL